ncbi:MAG: type I-C CRISPR-associated protein Cas8c/Csd1, partial [Pseudomonadota bacterium]|nr:type I-C CRISPR-associated protein Cas8c/Csd1 [Pseudomonadota bacterium]
MTILQSLASYYERMAARGEAEPPGFSREKISFAVVLDLTGEPVAVMDLRDSSGKRPVPALRDVPASFKRSGTGVHPFFLWDSSAYVFGVSSDETKRTAAKHQAFREHHAALLTSATDVGLLALRRFLEKWASERFSSAPFTPDMRDTNIVFRLDGDVDERGRPRFIHERPAARPLIEERSSEGETGFCLITGAEGRITRLHPAIKGVHANSPPPGGSYSLVSFNLPAFESWGKTQGANAPTGQAAAFRYGAALNRLLDRGSRNRIRIGDATVAFWADASAAEENPAAAAEAFLASLLGEVEKREDYDTQQAAKLREALESLAKGQPTRIGTDELYPETRIHILGLSANGPRLSVRFWLTESLGELASNLRAHERDCRVEPLPRQWGAGPSINRLLVKTVAAQE